MLHSLRFLSLLSLAPSVLSASAGDWQKRSIYQLLTDRFATDGTSAVCDTSARQYCGGSWKGIVNKLDYIQNMGFDAIWISPVVKNIEGNTSYGEAYHGYWTQDINSLNSHFGTSDDLKALSSALHDKGMYLMVDVVVNHVASTSTDLKLSDYAPFDASSDFHPLCWITDYTNQTNVEQCWLGDANLPLADLNTEDDNVVKTMNSWINGLVSTYNIDGVRIDTVKHVRKDFWPDFAKSAGVYTLGEVLSDNTTYTADYTQVIDGVLDYPTWFQVVAGFNNTSGDLSSLKAVVSAAQSSYKDGEFFTGSFLENQDQPRFGSLTKDQALIKNAMTWTFTNDGTPILYYGQEQGYQGGADPANRESLWNVDYQTTNPLVAHVTSLNKARKAASSSQSKFLTTAVQFIDQSNPASSLIVSKPPLLTLLTNVGSSGSNTWKVNASTGSSLIGKSKTMVDTLSCNTVTSGSDGSLEVQSDGGNPMVLLPVSALSKDSTLCPKVSRSNAAMKLTSGPVVLAMSAVLSLLLLSF